MTLFPEIQGALKLLEFLKRLKGNKSNLKGRFMNIILCSMQLITPLLSVASLMVVMGQESKFSMITKSYMVLGTICNIDNSFASGLPKEIFDNAKMLNKQKALKITHDNNTSSKIIKRLLKPKKGCSLNLIFSELGNFVINIWIFLIQNFLIVIFNYFGALLVLLVQFLGY